MNAKRKGLADMLEQAPPAPPPLPARAPAPPESQALVQQTPVTRSPEVPRSRPARAARVPQAEGPQFGGPELPKYRRLERKEFLIWPDDLTQLSILARALNRRRTAAGERITVNTLLRIGARYVLTHAGELEGNDEEGLLRSLDL